MSGRSPTTEDAAGRAARKAEIAGFALMVAATTLLGLFPIAAHYAYAGGSTPTAVSALRHALTFVMVVLLLCRSRTADAPNCLTLPRRLLPAGFAMGVVLAVFSWAYLASLRYIPVSLAVLLLYTFPAQVVVISAAIGLERATPGRVLAIAVAFAGVALAVGVGDTLPDWRGVVLGLIAGFGLAVVSVASARVSGDAVGRPLIAHMAAVAALLTVLATWAEPGPGLPTGSGAWTAFLIAGGMAGLGMTLYLVALPLIGPVRAALLANLETVVAILGAVLVLGEHPGPARYLGIALVLGAIVLLQVADRRRRRKYPVLP